jgi:phosphatidylserine decarboxylase
MKIHKEGNAIVFATSILALTIVVTIANVSNDNVLCCSIAGFIGIAVLFFTLRFFRNPLRKVIPDNSIVLAPADGKIVAIEEVYETEFLNRECIKVSIFMSVWDVHINRYPVNGRVSYTKYHPGNYFIASYPKSSELNEHQTVVIESPNGIGIMVKQIAGAVARRVVCYAKTGEYAIQGEDLGFIKFGSMVDLFLPLSAEILVSMNEKIKGNITVISRFHP